jgi:alpha/beta hydrolase fold
MDQLPALGTVINEIIPPTAKIYGQLLSRNADAIKKTKKTSHKFGPHPRHELDVYYPSDESIHDDAPVLMFVHGGGLVHGDRVIHTEPIDGLLYANIGHYFAEECGYITVVTTYRLVFQHDAKFPTGGEDVGLAVQCVKDQLSVEAKPRDLFIMGHSAGGIHTATWLFAPPFETALATVTGELKRQPVKLRGIIFLGVPLHWKGATKDREEMIQTYHGNRRDEDSPLGLLKDLQTRSPDKWPLKNVEFVVMDAEFDAEDEIRSTTTDFLGQWLSSGPAEMKDKITYRELTGHNHMSPVQSLGTGIEKEEAWAEEVSGFIENIRRREQMEKDIKILQESIKHLPPAKAATKADSKEKEGKETK